MSPRPSPQSDDKGLRVLVVDDDRLVGAALARLLKGYRVTFSQSAVGALARIQAGARFVTIVCDLNMPGMSGIELHDAIATVDERLARRIIFVSGAVSERGTEFLRRTGNPYVEKPVEAAVLLDAVRTMVETAGGESGEGRAARTSADEEGER